MKIWTMRGGPRPAFDAALQPQQACALAVEQAA